MRYPEDGTAISRGIRVGNSIFVIPWFRQQIRFGHEKFIIFTENFHTIGKDIYIERERESPFYVSIYLIRFTNTFGFLIKKLETEDEMT